jgi:hypothetical protein
MSTQGGRKPLRPALILGLDGACFEVLDPLIAAGNRRIRPLALSGRLPTAAEHRPADELPGLVGLPDWARARTSARIESVRARSAA